MAKKTGTNRYTRRVKKQFVKNLDETGNNKTEAVLKTFPKVHNRQVASNIGSMLFRDKEVQEIYNTEGIDTPFLAKRTKELMESTNENVASQHVKQFNAALLSKGNVQEVRKLNVNLFGDLNDAQVERIRAGKIIEGETGGTGEAVPE